MVAHEYSDPANELPGRGRDREEGTAISPNMEGPRILGGGMGPWQGGRPATEAQGTDRARPKVMENSVPRSCGLKS